MALDRREIEKSDFPVSRRGYEPRAVDAHLRAVADRLEELEREYRSQSVASAASEQVRSIVAAAESSAAEIRRAAEQRARESEEQTAAETDRVRADANRKAKARVEEVRAATARMLERLEAVDEELSTLVANLRSGGERLDSGLAELAGSLSELAEEAAPAEPMSSDHARGEPPAPEPEPSEAEREPKPSDAVAERERSEPDREPADAEGEPPAAEHVAPPAADRPAPPTPGEPAATPAEPAVDGAEEKARLIALDMALSGKPREETDDYLARNFVLADRARLVDEIYANVAGTGR